MPNPREGQGNAGGNQSKLDKELVNWTRNVGIFTALLFLTSCVSDYFIYCQVQGANRDRTETHEQLRAYVGPPAIKSTPSIDPKTGIRGQAFIAVFTNLGSTRTGTFQSWVSLKYFAGGVPDNLDLSKPYSKMGPLPNNTIGPSGALPTEPVTVTNDEVQAAAAGQGVILIWGAAQYTDVFNPKLPRYVRFCDVLPPIALAKDNWNFFPQIYRSDCTAS